MKCKYFNIRTKKGIKYYYCKLHKKNVTPSCYRECVNKKYKQYKILSKRSKKQTKKEKQRFSIIYPNLDKCCLCGSKWLLTTHEIFGGRNNYETWIEQNKDKIIYDKDDGIIKKRVNGDWLQLPTRINSSTNDGITNNKKSQIAPLPSQYNMQQNRNNIPTKQTSKANTKVGEVKLPTKETKTNKTSIPMAKKDDVIKVASQKIAKNGI